MGRRAGGEGGGGKATMTSMVVRREGNPAAAVGHSVNGQRWPAPRTLARDLHWDRHHDKRRVCRAGTCVACARADVVGIRSHRHECRTLSTERLNRKCVWGEVEQGGERMRTHRDIGYRDYSGKTDVRVCAGTAPT